MIVVLASLYVYKLYVLISSQNQCQEKWEAFKLAHQSEDTVPGLLNENDAENLGLPPPLPEIWSDMI